MESLKFKPLTMAELQSDIEILSQSGRGSTRKKAPAQRKWLNTQSSAKKNSQIVPRIQVTNDSHSDTNIINQFRILSIAQLQADIDILSEKKNPGSARKPVNPRYHPPHFSAKYDKSDSKSKFYANRAHSATVPKSIRRSIGKSRITCNRDVGMEHSKTRKALTFPPEISRIPQIRKDSPSSSNVSTKSAPFCDLNTTNGNPMTKHKLSKSQFGKLHSPSVTYGRTNFKYIARTLSETSRISGVNLCPQSPVTSKVARPTLANNQSKMINENTELSRISESPSMSRLSKGDTSSNSDESFIEREKELCCSKIDGGDIAKDFTAPNQNLNKLLDISSDAAAIHKPDTCNGNATYKELQIDHKINVLCDKFKKAPDKPAAHIQHEQIFQFKSKLEVERRILLRQDKQLQQLLNLNKDMLDVINDIVTRDVEDENIVLNEAAKSPKSELNTEHITISNATTPPSSKSKCYNQRISPVFVIPQKTSCLRKKVLSKSFCAESHTTVTDGNKPLAMYMQMKENWTFLQTPNKPNFDSFTQNRAQNSPLISFCLQRQLNKLYGKDTSQT